MRRSQIALVLAAFFVFALTLLPTLVFAQAQDGGWNNSGGADVTSSDYCATCTDHGALNTALTKITTAAQGAIAPFRAYSHRIFIALMLLSTLWWAFTIFMKKNDIADIGVSIGFRLMSLIFFNYLFIQAADGQLFLSIINSISNLSGVNGTAGSAINGLDPSQIVTLYTGLTNDVTDPATSLGQTIVADGGNPIQVAKDYVMNTMLGSITTSVFDLIMWASGAIIACEVLIFRAEQEIALPLLVLVVAFVGSGWTMSIGERALAYALSIGIRLATAGIVITVTQSVFSTSVSDMKTNGLFTNVSPETLGVLVIVSLVSVGLAVFIPLIAASALSGSPQMTFTGLATVSTAISAGVTRAVANTGLSGLSALAKHAPAISANSADTFGRGAAKLEAAGMYGLAAPLRGAQGASAFAADKSRPIANHLRTAISGTNPQTGQPNDEPKGAKHSVNQLRQVALPGGNQGVSAPAIRLNHHEN